MFIISPMKTFLIFTFFLFSSFVFAQEMDETKQLSFDENFYDAMAYRLKEDYKKSNDLFFSCLHINPQSDVALFKISQNYMNLHKYNEAENYIKKAIAINPGNKWYKIALIRIQILKGNKEKDILKQINAFKNKAHNKYIVAALYRELYNRKKKGTAPTIKKNTDNIEELDKLFSQQQYKQLIKKAEKSLESNPNDPEIYFKTAQAYFKLNQNNEALDYLDMGMDFVLNNKKLLKNYYSLYAQIYKDMGNLKKYNYYKSKSEKL